MVQDLLQILNYLSTWVCGFIQQILLTANRSFTRQQLDKREWQTFFLNCYIPGMHFICLFSLFNLSHFGSKQRAYPLWSQIRGPPN